MSKAKKKKRVLKLKMKKMGAVGVIIGILLITEEWWSCDGCSDYERNALLELRASFGLYDWTIYDDCCQSDGVDCSSSTGRVTGLSIPDYDMTDKSKEYYFNASLFLPFHQLTSLTLEFINMVDCVENQGFERLSELKNLESLDLTWNHFKNRKVLSSIANISSLKSLSLAVIELEAMDEIQWLSKLGKLEKLDLSGNNFNNKKPLSLPPLPSLHSLHLDECGLKGTIDIQELIGDVISLKDLSLASNEIESFSGFLSLNHTSSLKYLNLASNKLQGSISLEELDAFGNLQVLDLGRNQINEVVGSNVGTYFEGLSKLEKLEELDLSLNNFNSRKPFSLPPLPSLRSLYLYECGLKGTIDLQGLSKFEKLEELDLSGNNFNSSKSLSLPPLPSLHTLYLISCELKGTIDIQELDAFGNLEELDLSENQINKVIGSRGVNVSRNLRALNLDYVASNERSKVELHSLGAYPHLNTISLMDNQFEGPIFVEEMSNLSNVKELFLNYSFLDEESFRSLQALPSLRVLSLYGVNVTLPSQGFSNFINLEYLDMASSTVQGSIGKDIKRMKSLKTLLLADCKLSTLLTIEDLCKLGHLEELDISNVGFFGPLPWCMTNFTSLKKLDLSSNHFNGSISESPLRSLTSLQELKISTNQFQVPLSLDPFFNHSKLKYLGAKDNIIYHDEKKDVHNLRPKFQLETLILSSRGNEGAFPKFLYHQHNLQYVDLSNIQLKVEFPFWLLANNTRLHGLHLANTSLLGPLQLPIGSHEYFSYLDISANHLNGIIPINIGRVFQNLFFLNLSRNNFMDGIPSSLAEIHPLRFLDLSYNWLSGKIPKDLFKGCSLLYGVILSDNNFQGRIFSNSLLNCTWLSILDVSNNHLFGNIPGWIANMSLLKVLDLSNNSFSGTLPPHFCPSYIREVYLSNNKLHGSLGIAFSNCFELMTLDLSHNQLIGNIPGWIGELPKLRYILLSYNNIQGELPIELCNLDRLGLLDLSNNNLSSSILSCLRFSSKYIEPINESFYSRHAYDVSPMQQPLEFTIKRITYAFQGSILKYISGMDLSCNNFIGEIPVEIGNLSTIQFLNLSHNNLTRHIPQSFSNLTQIESLDLSHNNLNGHIPPQLTQLYSLSDFSVAYNNLSGKTPEMVAQFATFEKSSFEGNPLLCGPPLLESCEIEDSPPLISTTSIAGEDSGFIDMTCFYVSFFIAYVIVLLSIVAVLSINSYWRRAWFNMIVVSLRNCCYFIEDVVLALKKFRAS